MNAAVIAAAGITVLAVLLFLAEDGLLIEGHARPGAHILNAGRWALVIALSWALIPLALSQPEWFRGAAVLSLAALIGALMLLPLRWFVRLGGREPAWDLRQARVEAARLANKVRREPGSVSLGRLQLALNRISALRTSQTSELCDLLVAELDDLMAGSESWNEAGRRSIRIAELSRELWSGRVPPPDFDPDEATFRWRLYRAFGEMMEIGMLDLTLESRASFVELMSSLEDFRRPDTSAFIDDVEKSAELWLARWPVRPPWIAPFDFGILGPNGLDEVREIWGRDAALWGAHLDDVDRLAIKEDLARRA